MTRTILAVVLILIGIVGIAGGIWGFSLQSASGVSPAVLNAAETVLEYADSAVSAADDQLNRWTGGKFTLTSFLDDLAGDKVNLASTNSVERFALLHALEILLFGIIGVETGLLLFKFGR